MEKRKNKNRGYQKLRVWNDAIDLYVKACHVFRKFPYELKRVASQNIAWQILFIEILQKAIAEDP